MSEVILSAELSLVEMLSQGEAEIEPEGGIDDDETATDEVAETSPDSRDIDW